MDNNPNKSIKDQVIERMISELESTQLFSAETLKKLSTIDLTNKVDIKNTLENKGMSKLNEDTQD